MIFISYRISDSLDLVDRLDADLSARLGVDSVFRDKSRLKGGDEWTEKLESNAKSRAVMLAVIGDSWQKAADNDGDWKSIPRLMNPADWVRKEITLSLDAGNMVIPVLLNETQMPSKGWLATCGLERLFSKQAIRIRTSSYFHDLSDLIDRLRSCLPGLPADAQPSPVVRFAMPLPPAPPDYYADIEYILTNVFIGRASELDLLDAWGRSADRFLVVEGLGGLGKSALTWEWFQNRAIYAIPHLAGRVWGDFYGPEASLENFVRNTLAYITRQFPPQDFSIQKSTRLLLGELKKQPYLLVLDGFERVLAAYHRWDKAQQRDDKIDPTLRQCVDPKDAEVLRQLLNCAPSKIMISSRLFPSALEDRGVIVRGVAHHHLNGLSRADTLAYFRHVGIRGNEQSMLEFSKKFGNHSLVLKVICGDICNYPRKPRNFDAWLSDPLYGGKIKLSELDLKKNYTHILAFALTGLDEAKQKLLTRLAVLSEHLDYETISVINPYLPAREPGVRLEDYYQSAAVQEARLRFDQSLRELSDRGLVQWDRQTGFFDMHPVVRGYAADLIPENERKTTFLAVRDHFQAMPEEDHKAATALAQVRQSIELYKSLLGAGLWDEAAQFYSTGEFASTLLFRIGSFALVEELLKPLLECDKQGISNLSRPSRRSFVVNSLAIAMSCLGRDEDSLALFEQGLRMDIDETRWSYAATKLRNWSSTAWDLGRRAVSVAAASLAEEISRKVEDGYGVTMSILGAAATAIRQGRFDDGEKLLAEFNSRPRPQFSLYRPGGAERLHCFNLLQRGQWSEEVWKKSFAIAIESKSSIDQHRLMALWGEWSLAQDQPNEALDAIDDALKIANRSGMLVTEYHDLRAQALAELDRLDEAREELDQGEQRLFAGEAWRCLGGLEKARDCALNAYCHAWGEGSPHILWYRLERSRTLLNKLGVAEPQLPAFDSRNVQPLPFEKELRVLLPSMKPSRADCIFLVKGEDSTGRSAWYYVEVPRSAEEEFVRRPMGKEFNLLEYGAILHSGYGDEPPPEVKKQMEDEYGFFGD